VFGGKQTSEFWRTIFLDGTAPQDQQVLAAPLIIMEMISGAGYLVGLTRQPASRRYLLGTDDGIRTRDPHLGKAARAVRLVLLSPVTWPFVRPVVRPDRRNPPCSRTVYYELSR